MKEKALKLFREERPNSGLYYWTQQRCYLLLHCAALSGHGLLPHRHTLGTEPTLLHNPMAHTHVLHTNERHTTSVLPDSNAMDSLPRSNLTLDILETPSQIPYSVSLIHQSACIPLRHKKFEDLGILRSNRVTIIHNRIQFHHIHQIANAAKTDFPTYCPFIPNPSVKIPRYCHFIKIFP